jgi:hypothetical protein
MRMAGYRLAGRQKTIALTFLGIGVLAALYAIGIAPAREEANLHATRCIELKGASSRCDKVNRNYLNAKLAIEYDRTMQRRKTLLDAKAKQEEYIKMRKAAEVTRIAAAKEANFKAEGWWEVEDGIFVRWCKPQNPCPETHSYTDYTWRAMVWCKNRACGDIYARINILQGATVVGWTNNTAYGDIGQKVMLTFGSYTQGNAQMVEFITR